MTDIPSTVADLAHLLDAIRTADLATIEAQAAVTAAKQHVEDQQDAVTADALEAEGLTNDAKRKAHVAACLRSDTLLKILRTDLARAQGVLATAQADLADAERRVKGAQHSLTALGQLAFREGCQLQAEAFGRYLRAAEKQLEARR